MSYTTIQNVAGMYPAFVRGTPQQKPPDALIQQYIDDAAGAIDAALAKRFGEVIAETNAGSFALFQASFSADAQNLLERINRFGAAAGLGETLASFGAASAARLASDFRSEYQNLVEELAGSAAKNGAAGLYDHLFDPQSATSSPRPALEGVAGGDQPKGQTPAESGSSNFFGKFDIR